MNADTFLVLISICSAACKSELLSSHLDSSETFYNSYSVCFKFRLSKNMNFFSKTQQKSKLSVSFEKALNKSKRTNKT